MSAELFYIFDTHCPWSFAALPLVNEIAQAFPEIDVHLCHCARYEGDENISKQTIENVKIESNITFTPAYINNLSKAKNSIITANVIAWVQHKVPHLALPVLNALFHAHFEHANELAAMDDIADIIREFKLSPPKKIFTGDQLIREALVTMHDIDELQEIIGTQAIPAILLAIDDKLLLLNHNLYLKSPNAIADAVALELK